MQASDGERRAAFVILVAAAIFIVGGVGTTLAAAMRPTDWVARTYGLCLLALGGSIALRLLVWFKEEARLAVA